MSLRLAFVQQASQPAAVLSALCAQFGISRPTGYKWLARYRAGGVAALADRSRRPHRSPAQTDAAQEAQLVALRDQHPAWGARKLRARAQALEPTAAPQRFCHPEPNDLWQLDFKGHLPLLAATGRCHPLTALDDHSRFALGLRACADERTATVQAALTTLFQEYGLPQRILCDNGAPWGTAGAPTPWTPLWVWLARLGVELRHGRAYHPQTQGKEERFHRSLTAEALTQPLRTLAQAQTHFDAWRQVYNHERPHEALALTVPATHYHPSPRPFPATLPAIGYDATCAVRRVQQHGEFCWHGHAYQLSRAFAGLPVGIRPTDTDGCFAVYFLDQQLITLDTCTHTVYPVHRPRGVKHVPEHL